MQKGWVKLHRRIQSHWLYQEKRTFSRYEAWLDLIMMANHKQTKVLLGNEVVQVHEGQVITSQTILMKKWNWGKSRLLAFLDILEKESMIIRESDRKKTTITICNYNNYHDDTKESRPQLDHEKTDNGLLSDTIKNVKNVKNVKKENKRHKFSTRDMSLAKLLFQMIRQNNANHKEPNLEKWASDIRLMRERDKRTEEQIEYLIKWSQSHSFWHANILSTAKLRQQFDTLIMQVKQDNKSDKVVPMRKELQKDDGYDYGF